MDVKKGGRHGMSSHRLYTLGTYIYRLRWWIIVLWMILLLACIPFIPHLITPFKTTGFIDEQSASAKAQQHLNQTFGYDHNNQIILMFHSKSLLATDPNFVQKIKKALSDLKDYPIPHEIIYPDPGSKQISKDKHTAYAVVLIKSMKPISSEQLKDFKKRIKTPSHMSMIFGGEPIFIHDVNLQTQEDLYHADMIATPVAIITLLLVFGSITAAILPILLGGACALILLTSLSGLGHIFSLSIFTLNIALLLGLCLCLDYALLMISRFRDELNQKVTIIDAIATTQATAGKAILFSGLAVMISLSALLMFPVNILFSVAIGGGLAVMMAMLTAMILLPAILSILNQRINAGSIPWLRKKGSSESPFWHGLATKIVRHPYLYGLLILCILLTLGYPILSIKLGISDFHIFPEHSENRKFYDTFAEKYNERELAPLLMIAESKHSPILSSHNLSKLYHFTHRLNQKEEIKQVNSIVTTKPRLTQSQYDQLYHLPKNTMSESVKQLLHMTTRKEMTLLSIVSESSNNAPETKDLIQDLRHMKPGHGIQTHLTGQPVINLEVLNSVSEKLPYALLWIFASTYIIMFLLLRSVILPLKAIIANLLSLSACYGALVLVFQEGYLHHFLRFQPQGMLDISLIVIIFCALFGFSMDYEVFLLSRIKETYDATHDTKKSIVYGTEKSGRIITSAALIVIVICGSFLVADILMVKAFGLGIAVAIFVDAFLIRTILVPSIMMILNQWNWYLPKWLGGGK